MNVLLVRVLMAVPAWMALDHFLVSALLEEQDQHAQKVSLLFLYSSQSATEF